VSGVDILIFKIYGSYLGHSSWYGFYYKIDEDEALIPHKSYMLVANHTSMTDIMLLLAITKNRLFLW
jgi:1-acyl-sn-glycerol-3-phosphate acyltransferase